MFALFVKAQIIYTDFIPDTTISASPSGSSIVLSLDLNRDSIVDLSLFVEQSYFHFGHSYYTCYDGEIYPADTNSKIAHMTNGAFGHGPCNTLVLDSGAVVDSNLPWSKSSTLNYDCNSARCVQPANREFFGLQLFIDGTVCYGWIRLQSTDRTITVCDMAINLTPNQPILASQFTIGINEIGETFSANIYPVPFNDYLKVEKSNDESAEIILYDIASRKLMQEKFTSSTVLNTEQLAKGVYLYELRNKAGVSKKGKVVKD